MKFFSLFVKNLYSRIERSFISGFFPPPPLCLALSAFFFCRVSTLEGFATKKSILLGLFAFGRKNVGMYKYSHAAISDPRLRDRKLVDELFPCLIMKPVYMRLGGRPLSFTAAISLRLFVFSSNSRPSAPPAHLLLGSSDGLLHDLS